MKREELKLADWFIFYIVILLVIIFVSIIYLMNVTSLFRNVKNKTLLIIGIIFVEYLVFDFIATFSVGYNGIFGMAALILEALN